MHKVLVIGDANVDIIVPYPKFLNMEKTLVEYPTPELQGGGTSANTAVALSRLGVSTVFLGTIGDDQYGKYIINDFIHEGVNISQLIIEPELNTVGVFAFIDENGERYLWGWPRENQAFKYINESKATVESLKEVSWVHSSGMSLVYNTSARSTIIKLFRMAYEMGIPTSFDLNLRVDNGKLEEEYRKSIYEIIQYTTFLLGSGKDEFNYLGENGKWKENAKSFVIDKRTVIVRNGAAGSIGISSSEELEIPAFPVEVVDTVGAGDVFNAGFIAKNLENASLEECLMNGNAVSGYTVGKKGARNAPNKNELYQFLQKY
jgi:aminoimidazole riboside kinase